MKIPEATFPFHVKFELLVVLLTDGVPSAVCVCQTPGIYTLTSGEWEFHTHEKHIELTDVLVTTQAILL